MRGQGELFFEQLKCGEGQSNTEPCLALSTNTFQPSLRQLSTKVFLLARGQLLFL